MVHIGAIDGHDVSNIVEIFTVFQLNNFCFSFIFKNLLIMCFLLGLAAKVGLNRLTRGMKVSSICVFDCATASQVKSRAAVELSRRVLQTRLD